MCYYRYVCILLTLIATVNCANILVIMGVPSPSHHIWFRSITYGLAQKSLHNVTVVSTDIETNPPENVHYIHLENVYKHMYSDTEDSPKLDIIARADSSSFDDTILLHDYCMIACTAIMKTTGLRTILNYPKNFKFDLIVFDFSCGPCLLILLEKFNYPPLVSATGFGNPPYLLDVIGGHNYYGYISYYSLRYDTEMNFWQRSYNVLSHAFSYLHRNYILLPRQDKLVRKYVDMDFPYLGDLEKRSVLALVNTHAAIDSPAPLAPNVIAVGGLQIQEPKPVPSDLEDFINKGKKGAVLFSLGTNIRSDDLGDYRQKCLLEAFGQIPEYNFLWKFETDKLPITPPKNVLVKPWMPQNDILAHPKIKLFISHSGLLSMQETTWHGVPIIGMPFVVDQHRNIFKAIEAGAAEKIDFQTITIEEIKEKILNVLENPIYREKMKLRSSRFRDQPEKPLDRALWWIDWVLRNPTPDHMQSPVLKLGFIKSNIYDILFVMFVIICLIFVVLYKLWRLIRRTSTSKVKQS